ncbi:metallopeptidase TldD-related protein [Nonomuraea sp. NPDC046802]|uniref:metallopeptidase TldD-related protein n=1 Tax=Nonomuraea sp. NPDC046802 TaxID=3154919 RepID=UPI0033E49AFD
MDDTDGRTVVLKSTPPAHDVELPTPDTGRWLDVLVARARVASRTRGPSLAAAFTVKSGYRRYSDRSGRGFEWPALWCRLHVSAEGGDQLTDGTSDLDEVPELLEAMAGELVERRATEPAALPTKRMPLVLSPTVSSVLMHELVGHVAERLPIGAQPQLIGPHSLSVIARHPRIAGFDDEGIAVGQVPIVVNGLLQGPVLGARAAGEGQAASGLAQAAWHQGPPQARCTHLLVNPGEPTGVMLAETGEAILCLDTSGAELFGHYALLGISASILLRDGQAIHRLPPFSVGLRLQDLPRHLTAVGDDVHHGRAGMCVKGDQALPTRVLAPSMVLRGVRPNGL